MRDRPFNPLGGTPGERTEARSGYRADYYVRNLITRVGQARIAGSEGPRQRILNRLVRAPRQERVCLGGGLGVDVCARVFQSRRSRPLRRISAATASRPTLSAPSTMGWTMPLHGSPTAISMSTFIAESGDGAPQRVITGTSTFTVGDRSITPSIQFGFIQSAESPEECAMLVFD